MPTTEKYGRIILAAAVLAFFFVVLASMIRGEFLTTFALAVAVVGAVGWLLMRVRR